MGRASNYNIGDTVIFTRPYKTLGVEKGERTPWRPERIAAAKGGVEVYRSEAMELRPGDRVRFTRNGPASGLTNGETATVESVERGGVLFRLDDGKIAKLGNGDAQLRHIDRAFAATVHAFQGRTVDRILAAMPAGNPKLTDQRAFYVAVSRARDTAMLVTDDAHKARGPTPAGDGRAAGCAQCDGETGRLGGRVRPRRGPGPGGESPDTRS